MKNKYLFLTLIVILLLVCPSVTLVNKVYAASDSVSMNLNWDDNCGVAPTITTSPNYLYFTSGDTVTLSVVNQSSQVLDISINGSGGTLSANGGNQTFTRTLSGSLSIQANPDSSTSCGYKSTSGYSYIYGASAISPLSCTVSNNKVWNVAANYNNVAPTDYLYRGSTYAGGFQTTKGGVGAGDFDTSFQFSAQTTAQTYYLYDGTSSSDLLLGQATCPATSTSSAQGSSSTSKTTPSSTTTTPTPSLSTATSSSSNNQVPTLKLSLLKVGNVKANLTSPISVNSGQTLTLSGQTVPGGVVTLTIHSNPRVVTVSADKNGNWIYVISGLGQGHHTVQASVKNPSSGQSSPTIQLLAFTIKPTAKTSSSNVLAYILVAVLLVVLLAAAVWFFINHKKKTSSSKDKSPQQPLKEQSKSLEKDTKVQDQ